MLRLSKHLRLQQTFIDDLKFTCSIVPSSFCFLISAATSRLTSNQIRFMGYLYEERAGLAPLLRSSLSSYGWQASELKEDNMFVPRQWRTTILTLQLPPIEKVVDIYCVITQMIWQLLLSVPKPLSPSAVISCCHPSFFPTMSGSLWKH